MVKKDLPELFYVQAGITRFAVILALGLNRYQEKGGIRYLMRLKSLLSSSMLGEYDQAMITQLKIDINQ